MKRAAVAPSQPLWVITSHYNPAGYRRRLLNFRAFRRNLAAPLLVVELAPAGHGQLHDDDADIVVRLNGDDRIWQKERLLNLAASLLPPHVRYVAWVDADVLFADPHWPEAACAVLDRHGGKLQLFANAAHVPPEIDPQSITPSQCADHAPLLNGISIAHALREGPIERIEQDWGRKGRRLESAANTYTALGFAWAARRDSFMASGLYDANVIGGGDSVAVFAMLDRLDTCWANRPYTEPHKAHARAWADRARQSGLFDSLNDLPQTAWHLWHGTMADRNYAGRYRILVDHDYDPQRDLVQEPGQPLRWANPDHPLARAVGDYFFARREDGEPASDGRSNTDR